MNLKLYLRRPAAAGALLMLLMAWAGPAHRASGAAGDDLGEAAETFRRANEAAMSDPGLSRELYREAALRYAHVIEGSGVRNGKLYTNLGHSYFLAGDYGGAILNYRRALRYLPHNRELLESLAHARSQCIDVFTMEQQARLWRGLCFWHYHFSQAGRLWLFGGAYAGLWLLLALRLFMKQKPRWTTWGMGAGIAICVMTGFSLAIHREAGRRHAAGVITDAEVVPRKGDSYVYDPAFTNSLHSGTEFDLLERREGWVHARFVSGETAWLPDGSVEFVVDDS